jgi:hypothetical protein
MMDDGTNVIACYKKCGLYSNVSWFRHKFDNVFPEFVYQGWLGCCGDDSWHGTSTAKM